MEMGAKLFKIQSYNSKPLFLNPEKFDILMDVVAVTAKICKNHISLPLVRESIAVLLDVWDKHETNKKLAVVRVIKRLHGVSISFRADYGETDQSASAAGKNAAKNRKKRGKAKQKRNAE